MPPTASVVCAGLATVDMLLHVPDPIIAGAKHRARDSAITTGGSAANAAAAVARLGGHALIAAVIGDDMFGEMLRADIAAMGADDALVQVRAGLPTPRSAVLIDAAGERTIVNHRAPELHGGGLPLPDPFPFGAALCDTRWPAGAADLMRAARGAGVPAVLDAEAPVRHAEDALRHASHVAFSEQGLEDFAGGADGAALRRAQADLGVWVCVTRGGAPVLVHDGSGITEIATFSITPVDTLGAGDVWHGAFTLALAEGRDERDAVRRANGAAALKSATHGGRRAIPDRAQLEAFLARHP
jgi:sugar/nucleoside kinase (ribokinase family)